MSSIRILHLSDLQSGSLNSWWATRQSWDTPPVYEGVFHKKLVEALQKGANPKHEFAVDLILVTGDVAERGKPSEYDAAYGLLSELRQSLQREFYSLPKVLIVPGNHDIDRDAAREAENQNSEERFHAKLSAYNQFVQRFDPDLCTSADKPFVSQPLRSGEDLEIRLVGLNSCIEESHRNQDHYGWVGNVQLDAIKSHLENLPKKDPYVLTIR
jgi:3',5'-cyclic AMP phosphodiesterase CpdA